MQGYENSRFLVSGVRIYRNKPTLHIDGVDEARLSNHPDSEVYKELEENESTITKVRPEIENGNIKIQTSITQKELDDFRIRYPILGKGECSVILTSLKLNQQKEDTYAILDDGNARKVAAKQGVNLTGTYGLLKTLKEKGHINEEQFNQCKQDMSKSKFRIDFNKVN